MEQDRSGVYFYANDRYLDWTIIFLRSFRRFNPCMPLILIPFDGNIEKTTALAAEFDFSVVTENLFYLDRIGLYFYPKSIWAAHFFRKFYAFWGPLKHFILMDTDIIVSDNLSPVLDEIENDPTRVLAVPVEREWAYKSPLPLAFESGKSMPFNGGCLASTRGLLQRKFVIEEARKHSEVSKIIDLRCMDQGFLNYCVHKAEIPCHSMALAAGRTSKACAMAIKDNVDYRDGRFYSDGIPALLMHWAGAKAVTPSGLTYQDALDYYRREISVPPGH